MNTLAIDFLESLSFYDDPYLTQKEHNGFTYEQYGLTRTGKMCRVTWFFKRDLCDKLMTRYPNEWDLFLDFDIDNVKTFEIVPEKARLV